MFDMARHIQVKALLEKTAEVEDQLNFNELEMVRHLKAKYDDPGHSDGDDVTVLEVILRNVEIRRGYDINIKTDPGRVIPFDVKAKDKT